MQNATVVVTNRNIAVNESSPICLLIVEDVDDFDLLKRRGSELRFVLEWDYWADTGGPQQVGYFSSKGPAFNGLLKPELVAPGSAILSARSDPEGGPDHGRTVLDIYDMKGTSMATPNVAGSAALLRQYFLEGRHHGAMVEPLGSLMKAVLINSADPLDENERAPNVESGFGALNLGRWLPLEGDNFAMIIGNGIPIGRRQHLVTSVSVTGKAKALRITICSFDRGGNAESWIPLFADLDLIVVGPNNEIYQGNHRPDKSDEHFSPVERVIVFESELVIGTYEIHVISSIHETGDEETFSIVAVGDIDGGNGYFTFTPATNCIADCGDGECDRATFTCKCDSKGEIGEFCQQKVIEISTDLTAVSMELDSLGIRYLSFAKPAGVAGDLTVWVNLTQSEIDGDHHDYWQFLIGNIQDPEGSAWTYDANCTEVSNICHISLALGSETQYGRGLLRNNSPNREAFEVWASFSEDESQRRSRLSVGVIAAIAAGGVVVVAGIVVAVVWIVRRRDGWENDVPEPEASTTPANSSFSL
jgi:hypothetical protein